MSKIVYVGMSGGVDSSVAAALLKEQGYEVVGVYMKNWSQDLPGHQCPWKQDFQDAKRVATQLGIKFKMYDFEKEYRDRVVNYMVEEYSAGRTPNPDVMCNQEIKFKLFLETALEDGADFIATGHYGRVENGKLLTGLDKNKDQSYFLYRVKQDALKKSLMPVGNLEKPEVRKLAKRLGLATAAKKDSQGICFVGKVGIKDFLVSELGPQEPGKIFDQNGNLLGEHEGALFYTIGQRHGLNVGGGLPYYVVGKNIEKNEVYVTTDLGDENLWHDDIKLTNLHWVNGAPKADTKLSIRTRYRSPLTKVKSIKRSTNGNYSAKLVDEIRAITPGQSAVFYEGDRVVGGGIVI